MRSYRNTPPISALRGVMRAHRTLLDENAEAIRHYGLPSGELDAVLALGNTSGLRMCELAAGMLTTPANVTRVVKALEGKGLATRTRSPRSDRDVIARLSPQGEELFERAYPALYRHWLAFFNARLSTEEQKTLNRLLEKVADAWVRPPEEDTD